MRNQNATFNTIRLIHFAQVMGSCLFLGVCLFIKERPIQENEMLVNIAMIIAVPSVFLAFFIPKFIANAKKNNSNQLNNYRVIKIIQGAILEGPALMNLVAFFLTANQNSMYTAIALTVVLISRFPTEKEMNELLPPPIEEKKNIDDRF